MDADSGSLMVASSDGRGRRHVPCDAHLSKARTDTRIVFNKHDAHTMRVWQQHVDATLDQRGLLYAATNLTLSFDDWDPHAFVIARAKHLEVRNSDCTSNREQ